MVGVQEFNVATGKDKLTYQNVRVLVGPKDGVEKAKTMMSEKVKGSYEL